MNKNNTEGSQSLPSPEATNDFIFIRW